MHKSSLTILLALLISFNTKAQNSLVISSIKFSDLKIGSSIDTLNKYLDNKIILKPLKSDDEYITDTIFTTYRGANIRLIFKHYTEYDTKKEITELTSVYSDSKTLRTKSGIKLRDKKYDIIRKLEGSYLSISPDENKRKNYSTVTLYDQVSYSQLTFYFKDNILYALECSGAETDYD